MLSLLKTKINFGKDDFSLKIEFSWTDTLKGSYYNSYNVNLEYYSNLFNLGVVYLQMGRFFTNATEDSKLKEGIKYYQNAAWIFDKIKQEYPTYIPVNEIQPDLSSNYLSYASFLCLAGAQSLLLTVAEKKKMSNELQAQLAKGVSDLYGSALNLANDTLRKFIDESTRIYLNNRKFFYSAIAFTKVKENYEEVFSKTGEGYGKQIAYLGLACDCLNAGAKDLNKISNLLDINEFNRFKSELEDLGNEMLEKNRRIYFDTVPELSNLPRVEKIIKVNPTQISDNLDKIENNVLDNLVPREIKPMIDNYKGLMMCYISENLDKFENEAKITNFLKELGLPVNLDTSSEEISDALWKKISEIQQKGGSLYLANQLANLEKRSEDIDLRLKELEILIFTEEDEDNKFRNIYGNKWNRQPSHFLNNQYIQILKDYRYNSTKHAISTNINNFDLLSYPKQLLEKKIPVKSNLSSNLKDKKEFIELKNELDTLEIFKEKCMEVIEKIFQILNEDNIVPQFLQVLQKKTTEKAIFTENKAKYDPYFEELQKLSEKISDLKKQVTIKNDNFIEMKVKTLNVEFKNEENEKFFKDLENNISLYNQLLFQVNQGANFYNEFNVKLNELKGKIIDYTVARAIEKEEIIKAINSGENYQLGSGQYKEYSYLDPQFNTITNLNYSYRYNKPGGGY